MKFQFSEISIYNHSVHRLNHLIWVNIIFYDLIKLWFSLFTAFSKRPHIGNAVVISNWVIPIYIFTLKVNNHSNVCICFYATNLTRHNSQYHFSCTVRSCILYNIYHIAWIINELRGDIVFKYKQISFLIVI